MPIREWNKHIPRINLTHDGDDSIGNFEERIGMDVCSFLRKELSSDYVVNLVISEDANGQRHGVHIAVALVPSKH